MSVRVTPAGPADLLRKRYHGMSASHLRGTFFTFHVFPSTYVFVRYPSRDEE
jgi:hypothetical protein